MKKTLLILAATLLCGLSASAQVYYIRLDGKLVRMPSEFVFYDEDLTLPTVSDYLANPPAGYTVAAEAIRTAFADYTFGTDRAYILAMPTDGLFNATLNTLSRHHRHAPAAYENNVVRDYIRKQNEAGYNATVQYFASPSEFLAHHLVYTYDQTFGTNPSYNPSTFSKGFEELKKNTLTLQAAGLPNWQYTLTDVYEMFDFAPTPLYCGVAYQMDQLAIDFDYTPQDCRIECDNLWIVYQRDIQNSPQSKVEVIPAPSQELQDTYGAVSGDFLSFRATGTANVSVTLKLPPMPNGCKYDVYAVTVPDVFCSGNEYTAAFKASINYIDDSGTASQTSEAMQVSATEVQTHLLFENFEFPYSYLGLPYSYPTITFSTERGESGLRKTKTNNLCIDYILFKLRE